jgi:hypothetical protein
MLPGKVRRGFFQESVLHLQLAVHPLQLPEPGTLGKLQRRLVLRVPFPVRPHPVTQAGLTDTELSRDIRDRPRVSTTILAASSRNSGEKFLYFFGT